MAQLMYLPILVDDLGIWSSLSTGMVLLLGKVIFECQ